jgi:hypothetical protein
LPSSSVILTNIHRGFTLKRSTVLILAILLGCKLSRSVISSLLIYGRHRSKRIGSITPGLNCTKECVGKSFNLIHYGSIAESA